MDLSPICLPMKWMFTTNFGVETLKITCMKAQISLCLWGMCLWVLETNAIDVKLQAKKVKDPNVPQQEIPVHADMNNSLLGVHFLNGVDVTITVVGPEGVAYQKEITTPFPESVYVDLSSYQKGEYTIYIKDKEGNLLWGSFMK